MQLQKELEIGNGSMKPVYIGLFVVGAIFLISRMYIMTSAIGMIVCFGLGFLLAKITK